MNINVKKTKDMRLGAGARKRPWRPIRIQELILDGNIENVNAV